MLNRKGRMRIKCYVTGRVAGKTSAIVTASLYADANIIKFCIIVGMGIKAVVIVAQTL
jgi:hypothetical protein